MPIRSQEQFLKEYYSVCGVGHCERHSNTMTTGFCKTGLPPPPVHNKTRESDDRRRVWQTHAHMECSSERERERIHVRSGMMCMRMFVYAGICMYVCACIGMCACVNQRTMSATLDPKVLSLSVSLSFI